MRVQTRRAVLTAPSAHLPAPALQEDFTFQMVLDALPADEPRYLVLDWAVENADGCQLSKIFFVSWCVPRPKPRKRKAQERFHRLPPRPTLPALQLPLTLPRRRHSSLSPGPPGVPRPSCEPANPQT